MKRIDQIHQRLYRLGLVPKKMPKRKVHFYDSDPDVDQEVRAEFTPFGIGYDYSTDWSIRESDETILSDLINIDIRERN